MPDVRRVSGGAVSLNIIRRAVSPGDRRRGRSAAWWTDLPSGRVPADVGIAILGRRPAGRRHRHSWGNYVVALLVIYLLLVAQSLGLSAVDRDLGFLVSPEASWAVAAQCGGWPAALVGGPPSCSHLTYFMLASDPDGHGGEQPYPDRAPCRAECRLRLAPLAAVNGQWRHACAPLPCVPRSPPCAAWPHWC